MSKSGNLFEDVVACSGLASWIAPGTVIRSLNTVGIKSPAAAHPDDYRRAIPQLKARMAMYLTVSEVEFHIQQIEALLR